MSDHAWLIQLFTKESHHLQNFLRRFGHEANAEEIAQESFARMCAADPSTIRSPRSYLFQTARNLALNEARRRRIARIDLIADPNVLALPSDQPTPEDQAVAADELARVQRALNELPAPQRRALILFKLEGMSHRQIGKILGVSHRTVERYVADALAHCTRALRAEGG